MLLLLRIARALVGIAAFALLTLVAVWVLALVGLLVPLKASGTQAMTTALPACDGRWLGESVTYFFFDPKRGDVAAFEATLSADGRYRPDPGGDEVLTRRVVGIPGDTVEGKDGFLLVNDEPADTVRTAPFPKVTLGGDSYFLVGDNRTASQDSRSFGPVPRQAITAKVRLVYWPLDEFGLPGGAQGTTPAGVVCNV